VEEAAGLSAGVDLRRRAVCVIDLDGHKRHYGVWLLPEESDAQLLLSSAEP
jgi:hypothetical protein